MKTNVKAFLFRVLCGFFLGVSVIAPGVSGSVMAVMMGIYRELIEIVSNPFKNLRRNFFYLLPMGMGALVSVALLIGALALAFERYPAQSRLLFMGLIGGGLWEIFRHVRRAGFKRHYLAGLLAAFALALAMGLLGREELAREAASLSLWYLCLAGGVAGIVSLAPGLSVSLMLMIFGVYDHLLHTASAMASNFGYFLRVAIPVGLCFVGGMVAFSRLTKLVFDRYPGFAYVVVLGFMCGTLVAVFPATPPATAGGWLVCGLLFVLGLAASLGFQLLGQQLRRDGAS